MSTMYQNIANVCCCIKKACCVVGHYKMTCCPEGKYTQNRELPEAGRTRPALYGLCEVARCTPLFLPRLLPLPRR
ncbi:hypothetical protein DNK66_02125 [Klebsiella aerogenes]|nr:hypothetical protein DNK66_02125 [Klebsiella aerogenes]